MTSKTETSNTDTAKRSGETRPAQRTGSGISQLQTDQGTTSIADSVVAKIARLAAQEVEGVAELGGVLSGAIASVVSRIRGDEHQTSGVGVEVGSQQAAVDLTAKVQYPASIPEVAESVRQNVIERIQTMTGLEVVEVNVAVTDLVFPGSEDEESSGRVQ